MNGILIKIPEVNKDDLITVNNNYRLMQAQNDKNSWVLWSDDNLKCLTIKKEYFNTKKAKKIKKDVKTNI